MQYLRVVSYEIVVKKKEKIEKKKKERRNIYNINKLHL